MRWLSPFTEAVLAIMHARTGIIFRRQTKNECRNRFLRYIGEAHCFARDKQLRKTKGTGRNQGLRSFSRSIVWSQHESAKFDGCAFGLRSCISRESEKFLKKPLLRWMESFAHEHRKSMYTAPLAGAMPNIANTIPET